MCRNVSAYSWKNCSKGGLIVLLMIFSVASWAQAIDYGSSVTGYDDASNPIPIQPIVDKAIPGEVILLKPGYYVGNLVIRTNGITVDGQGKATISAQGKGTVIDIQADSVTVKNLHIIESGGLHDKIDCGVNVQKHHNCTIDNCRIEECLFGVNLQQSDRNTVIHNEISSFLKRQTALKGDAIRLWYSARNTVNHNYWHHVRDMVVWYSKENHFEENRGENNRYGIHFMYSHNNWISRNELIGNSVGVFLMYSERTIMVNNLIMKSNGTSGMCLGLKETSSNQILNNRFIYSAEGIHFDVSPFVPEKKNTIMHNEIAFCGEAMHFHNQQRGNLIKHNYFHDNLIQIYTEAKTANLNKWENNYFDDYQGFDKDGDNIGDTPYRLYSYTEHLWDFNKNVKFFYGAPFLVALDFLERLAPFSEPKFVMADKTPLFFWDGEKYEE